MTHPIQQAHHYPEVSVPFFWPLGIAMSMGEQALELEQKNMKFLSGWQNKGQEKRHRSGGRSGGDTPTPRRIAYFDHSW